MWFFILVHCMVTFFTKLLAKFEFPARISNKTCLNLLCTAGVDLCSILRFTQRVQLLPILMFTRTATEARKRAHFKYVTKLLSKCEYKTLSLSISLMTYFRFMQLCHTRSICLTWREIIAATFHLPSCSSLKFFHISTPMVFEIPVCK